MAKSIPTVKIPSKPTDIEESEDNQDDEASRITVDEMKNFLRYMMDNNEYLQERGKVPISINIEGESGIGKTSGIKQLAEEKGCNFIKLSLTQIEELGDLVGFPIRQFEVKKGNDLRWVDEHLVDAFIKNLGFDGTGEHKMTYCPPEWIVGRSGGGIFLIDDWTRADLRFLQAIMELILCQEYISWKLPPGWNIFLTTNPADGEYLVNEIDKAQKTRFINKKLKFDHKCWARWAEEEGIDERCINFLLMNPETIKGEVNARSATMFFNAISSIKKFENEMPLIQSIGEGSVGDTFSNMFILFINNKLDKLISPEAILFEEDEEGIMRQLRHLIHEADGNYRSDIASTLITRLINYTNIYVKNKGVNDNLKQRLLRVFHEKVFEVDSSFQLMKSIYSANPGKFKEWCMDTKLVKIIGS